MKNMYHASLMDHYNNPRNQGSIEKPDFQVSVSNALCGDAITVYGVIKDGGLKELSFQAKGCIINQASASLISERIKGLFIKNIEAITDDVIVEWVGLELGPNRKRCALLLIEGIRNGIKRV